jgi:hypothetical protein
MLIVAVFLIFCRSTFRSDHAVSLGVVAPWYEVPLFDQMLCFLSDVSFDAARRFFVA